MPLTNDQQIKLALVEGAVTQALKVFPSTTPDTDQATAAHVMRELDATLTNHLAGIRAR